MDTALEPNRNRPVPDKQYTARRITPWLIFGIVTLFWISFIAFTSPKRGGTDAFIFRDAGCNCARGLGLVSNSVPTKGVSIPSQLFAAYTPGAPLLFAPAARIFGCSAYVDTYYNFFLLLIISICLLWLYFGFVEGEVLRLAATLTIGITLPGGLYLSAPDRPEAIALCLALPLLIVWKRTNSTRSRMLLIGCSGLLFLVHPFIGIIVFLLFVFLLASTPEQKSKFTIVLGGIAVASGTLILCVAYLHHLDPTVIHRFLNHALGAGTGAGVVLKGQHASVKHAGLTYRYEDILISKYFNKGAILSATPLISLICGFVMIAVFLMRLKSGTEDRYVSLQLACLFGILFLFPAAIFLPQRNYFAACGALLFAAITMGTFSLSSRLRRTAAPLVLLLITTFFSLPQFGLDLVSAVESHNSYLRASIEAKNAKSMFVSEGIAQPRILIDSSHYFLYKPYFTNLYNTAYLQPEDSTSEFQGLVRCYGGTLAHTRSQLGWQAPLRESDWKLIEGGEDVQLTTLFDHPIQRRNWTWSCDVYQRRDTNP